MSFEPPPPMRDDPVDLTPLDPDAVPGAEDRFVEAVMSRISAQPNRYPPSVDILWGVWSFARPVLIAASVAIVVAGVYIARTAGQSDQPRTLAESLGVPPQFRAPAAAPNAGRAP